MRPNESSVCILTPVRDGAAWARSVQLPPNTPCLASDSGSGDDTVAILEQRAYRVAVQQDQPDRTENWQRALAFFARETDAGSWAKWLFAGDHLHAGYLEALRTALASHPEAGLVVSPYDFLEPDGRRIRSHGFLTRQPGFDRARLLSPLEACQLAARHGNWFGPPLSQSIHRRTLDPLPEPGDLPWVADMAIALQVARQHPVLWLPVSAGTFDTAERRHFQAHRAAPESIIQTAILRYRAVEAVRSLDLPEDATTALRSSVDRVVTGELIQAGLIHRDDDWDAALFGRFDRGSLFRFLRYKFRRLLRRTHPASEG